jgi:hypothetical protein
MAKIYNSKEVKSFLATLQFSLHGGRKREKTYAQLVEPFRLVAKKKTRFTWTREMDVNFIQLKRGSAATGSWCRMRFGD